MRLGAAMLGLSLLACWPAPTGAAEKGRSWSAFADAEGSSLSYGTPQTDDTVLTLACTRAAKEVVVVLRHEPVGARDGVRLGMEVFSEGKGSIMLQATGHRLQLDDIFILEAKSALTPKLQRILTEGQTLSVMVQDGVKDIPLAGAAEGIAALIEACAP